MRTLWPRLAPWIESGEPFALATVVAVSGSAPRAPGASMAILPEQFRFLGSVSSGCLEHEVIDAAKDVLATGTTRRMRFGPDGAAPWSDGLTCGGWIEVRIDPWWAFHPRAEVRAIGSVIVGWLAKDEAGVVISSDEHHLALDSTGAIAAGDAHAFGEAMLYAARAHLRAQLPPAEIAIEGESRAPVFVRTLRARPRLVIVGATDITAHLVPLARNAGFATIVIDPRAAYLVEERFPTPPDRTIRAWPQSPVAELAPGPRDVALAVTHDPKIDDVALLAFLKTGAGYVGALGSTRSHVSRLERLRAEGADQVSIQRIHGPAGIHLGTPDAAGIALGMLAGIVQWQAEQERRRSALAAEQPNLHRR